MTLFETLRTHASERLGLHLSEERLEALSRFAERRRRAPGTPGAELEDFLNGETYFFRYPFYLSLLESRLRAGTGAFRVLCGACSTGEEAYSLAFALAGPARETGRRLEIVARDVRPKAIAAAREGVYGVWSLRSTSPQQRSSCFDALAGQRFRVKPELRSAVRFEVRNLLDPVEAEAFDAVVLCNATLYMHASAARAVYANVAASLASEGLLLISPTDPPPGAGWRPCPEYGGWSVFRRVSPGTEPVTPADPAPAPQPSVSIPPFSGTVPELPAPGRKPLPLRAPRRAKGRSRAASGVVVPHPAPGRTRPAAPSLSTLQAADTEVWTAWSCGRLASVEPGIRRRLFFEPEEPLWRFLLGVVLWERGWLRQSRREVEVAERLLRRLPHGARVSGLCTAAELSSVIDEWRTQHG